MTVGEADGEVRLADGQADAPLAGAGEPMPTGGIIGHAAGWLEATRERATAVTHLAIAEAKLAALSVALMALFGVLAAVCLLGAWGLLVAGLAHALVYLGLPLWAVLLLFGVGHVLAAWVSWRSAMRLSRHLEFAATRAQIRREPPGTPQ